MIQYHTQMKGMDPTLIGPTSRRTSDDSSDELCRFYSCLLKTYIAKSFVFVDTLLRDNVSLTKDTPFLRKYRAMRAGTSCT